jgi:hypothetical protein
LFIPKPTEWQRIGNQIDAAFIFAGSDFVSVNRRLHSRRTFNRFSLQCVAQKRQNPMREPPEAAPLNLTHNVRITRLADDFKTVNGKEYKNATVSHVESDGIVLRTKTGILKVYFVELPKDVQERFGYDPAKAARLKAAAQAAAAETATVQAQAGSNVHTVREVDSDQLSFIDQPFVLRGTIEISSYYNYGYYHAQETHDAFEVVDNTRSACHAYMDREKAGSAQRADPILFAQRDFFYASASIRLSRSFLLVAPIT